MVLLFLSKGGVLPSRISLGKMHYIEPLALTSKWLRWAVVNHLTKFFF